jgi:DNA-binding NarL/FixJ family response regulator
MQKPRVVIADDHRLVVAGLERLLAPECDIVGTATDTESLLNSARQLAPDVVLLDLSMPAYNALDVIRELRQFDPHMGIVVVTMNDDQEVAAATFRAGASAYVLKNCAATELLDAVRHVAARRAYLTPFLAAGVIDSLVNQTPNATARDELTSRQRQVLRLLAEGLSMKEVAAELHVAVRTVAFHKYHMMKQLNIKSSAELVRYAVSRHIV